MPQSAYSWSWERLENSNVICRKINTKLTPQPKKLWIKCKSNEIRKRNTNHRRCVLFSFHLSSLFRIDCAQPWSIRASRASRVNSNKCEWFGIVDACACVCVQYLCHINESNLNCLFTFYLRNSTTFGFLFFHLCQRHRWERKNSAGGRPWQEIMLWIDFILIVPTKNEGYSWRIESMPMNWARFMGMGCGMLFQIIWWIASRNSHVYNHNFMFVSQSIDVQMELLQQTANSFRYCKCGG